MTDRLTRRQFLKASAVTAAGAAAASVLSGCSPGLQRTEYLESYVVPPEQGLPGESLWYASTCRQCPAGCGIVVRVSNGRARKVEGNPLHPVNAGKLCARGQAALQELYDPDRLRNAVRQRSRGTQVYEPIYWDDALADLAGRLRGTDPARVAMLLGDPSAHLWRIVSAFASALGARPPLVYTLGDALAGQQVLVAGSEALLGTAAMPVYDIGHAEAVFSFGAHFLETWLSPVHYSRAYARMRRGDLGKRGYLVQFEPRLSATGASADEWVPVQPGTGGLVAIALGKIMIEEGLVPADTSGADAFTASEVTPASASDASGVSVEHLARLARIFSGVERAVAVPGGPLAGCGNGAAAMVAVQALNALASHSGGGVGQPGGVYVSPAGAMGAGFEVPPVSSYADVQALIADMDAGRVDVLLVHGANPSYELPAASGFHRVLDRVSSVISFSPAVDETAAVSDLVLPDHANLEGWGYHVPSVADRPIVSSQQPVMRPLYDTRATGDVFLAVARNLGGAVSDALPWPNEVEFLQEAVGVLNADGAAPEAFWAGWRRQGGHWPEEAQWVAPAASAAIGPLAVPAPAPPVDPGSFPLALHLYPSITLYDGRGANKPWLQETPDPMTTVSWQTWVEMHPETAHELEVEDGALVRVISPAGEVEAIVYTYPGIAPGVVAMPAGQGHEHYGRFAKGYGSNPMRLVMPNVEAETGALTWAATFVRVEPTGRWKALARLESAEGIEYLQEEH
jgi:anaerobic selenocysteine-containing dehydrogenase